MGLQRGDVLLAVFGTGPFGERELPVSSLRDFARLLEQQRGKALKFAILRGQEDLVGTIEVRGRARRQ